jgi:hypothetical protein
MAPALKHRLTFKCPFGTNSSASEEHPIVDRSFMAGKSDPPSFTLLVPEGRLILPNAAWSDEIVFRGRKNKDRKGY